MVKKKYLKNQPPPSSRKRQKKPPKTEKRPNRPREAPTPGNPANDCKGGHGLAHILAKHPSAKDSILDTLQKGEAYKHDTSRSKLYLIHGNTVAVLTKLRTGRLLVTDYGELTEREIGRFKAEGKYHARGENQKK